jgi:hypothetical protein
MHRKPRRRVILSHCTDVKDCWERLQKSLQTIRWFGRTGVKGMFPEKSIRGLRQALYDAVQDVQFTVTRLCILGWRDNFHNKKHVNAFLQNVCRMTWIYHMYGGPRGYSDYIHVVWDETDESMQKVSVQMHYRFNKSIYSYHPMTLEVNRFRGDLARVQLVASTHF